MQVNRKVDALAAYSWRFIVIAVVGLATLYLMGQLWVIVLASVVAVFLARIVAPLNGLVRRKGAKPLAAALVSLGALGVFVVGILSAVVPSVVDQFVDLGPILTNAVDDVEAWLVDDSPFAVSHADIDEFREQAGEAISAAVSSESAAVVSGALAVVEGFLAILLGLVTAFFLIKDGDRFADFLLRRFPPEQRPLVSRLGARAWKALGGYLKGAALLGVAEGAIMGIAVTVVGGELGVPVAVITFLAAFVPFVGAIAAGVVAVAVALVTAGGTGALIVAIVALAVQQVDNEILAPLVYGRTLELHPVMILFGLAAGSALFGAAGAILAVPVTAVIVNVIAEANRTPVPAA